MNVRFSRAWEVEIDHVFHLPKVDSTRDAVLTVLLPFLLCSSLLLFSLDCFIRCEEVVVDAFVELRYDVLSGLDGQLRIQDARLDAKLVKEDFQSVASIDVVDEEECLPSQ